MSFAHTAHSRFLIPEVAPIDQYDHRDDRFGTGYWWDNGEGEYAGRHYQAWSAEGGAAWANFFWESGPIRE